ncbi:MAG: FAD binding domain-containing protein [Peptococcales bacterium]|jgi:CO/xanthine dehydrogenase FAD-binding subunit
MTKVNYLVPRDLEKAAKYISEGPTETKIIAGGTDLLIALREKRVQPSCILDITKIPEMKLIKVEGEEVHLGAAVTCSQIIEHEMLSERVQVLTQAAKSVGSPQIRNRATLGGNIANASPAADLVPALLALETLVTTYSIRGKRTFKLEEILDRPGRTKLLPDEIIIRLSFKLPSTNSRTSFVKLGRRNALAIARMNVALVVEFESATSARIIKDIVMALGAVGPCAYIYHGINEFLQKKELNESTIETACLMVSDEVAFRLGDRSTAPYKKEAVKGIVCEALNKVLR